MQRLDGDDPLVVDCWAFSCKDPGLQGQPQTTMAPCGDGNLIARLMELNMLADAAAQAMLDSRSLPAADAAALLSLWPWLLRLTVEAHSTGMEAHSTSSCSPFAAQAGIVLAERPGALPAASAFTCPATAQPPHGSTLRFEMAAPAGPQQQAELQVFVQQLRLGVEQSSKEAMEEALSEISRLPSACEIVRGSIEGQQQPMLSLRSLLKRRSSTLSSAGNSCTDTPLRWSRNSDA